MELIIVNVMLVSQEMDVYVMVIAHSYIYIPQQPQSI